MSLEGNWIEVFRAGDYGERGNWTAGDLDRLAATYDARLHAAPVVLGHPADDAPAYGWVKRLRRAGESLWAQLEKVDPALEALLRAGRFAQRSVALYKQFPLTGGPYLRHLGFLGAAPPAVKGLAPLRFMDAPSVSFTLNSGRCTATSDQCQELHKSLVASGQSRSPEALMSEPKSKLESFIDHLRGFFVPDTPNPTATPTGEGSADPSPAPSPGAETFAERLAALEQRLDTVAGAKTAAEQKLNDTETARRQEQIANFVESLRIRGRFPPMFERWGVHEFMERLAAIPNSSVIPSEARDLLVEKQVPRLRPSGSARNDMEAGPEMCGNDDPTQPTLLEWFQQFLAKLPAVIEFRELALSTSRESPVASRSSRLVRFTEPQRGMSVDPESVELAERAEALAAEENISYAEALAQLRDQNRSNITSA